MALVADVFDVILIDKQTRDTIATTTLQTANIEVSVSENEVRAGKGNALIGVLHVSRDINVPLTDAEFKYDWLAKQLGQPIKTGAGVAYAMPKYYTASGTTSIKITLDEVPLADSLVVYKSDGTKIEKANYNIGTGTGNKDVTFTTGVLDGEKVEVRTYKYTTSAQTQTIEIDNSIFAKGVELILETIEISGDERPVAKLQYQFDTAVPTGNFSIQTASERNAQAQQFDLKVIKPTDSTVVGKILRIPLV